MSLGLPVGLMRSPMTAMSALPAGRSTASWALVMTKSSGSSRRTGAPLRCTRAASCSMKAGLVPQQPPTTTAPASTMPSMAWANSRGVTSKTVAPSSMRGRPALGCTMSGTRQVLASCATISPICAGPSEQLLPTAWAPRADSVAAATAGVVPKKVRPSSSKVMVTNTGRVLFSRQASTAALASRRSETVSMASMSQPAACAARACSAKSSYASWNESSPMGSSKAPRGPMSPAT